MSFLNDMSRIAQNVERRGGMLSKVIVMKMHGRLDEMAPVDTGRFRSNWQYGFNYQNPAVDYSAHDPTGRAARERISAAIQPRRGVHFLTNNLDYARDLEFGKSQQAPQGFVRIVVREFENIVASTSVGV